MAEDRGEDLALITPTIRVLDDEIAYDGTQLAPHWIFDSFGIQGDAAVAFVGPVDVPLEHMVDRADVRDGLAISGDRMLHVIAESFGPDLDRAVFLQRLLVLLAAELLAGEGVADLRRSGDDLFIGEGKLSVSIATVSRVSCLVHFGLNVVTSGTPIRTAGLDPAGIDPRVFSQRLLAAYAEELEGMRLATTKVRGV